MAAWEDYYEILQVHHSAEPEVIEAAYRKLAQKYHPDVDKSPEATEKMKRIIVARDILRDPSKRREYDLDWQRLKGTGAAKKPRSGVYEPKPVVQPEIIHFKDVKPGEAQTGSFLIRNAGGPYSKISFGPNNPESWVRVVRYHSLTLSDELPLQVEIEAEGEDWGRSYSEYIVVKLDENGTHVRIGLQTMPSPWRFPNPMPLTLSIGTVDNISEPVIRRGTSIPISAYGVFETAAEGQTSISIPVLQGERLIASQNWVLGVVVASGILSVPHRTSLVEIKFTVDQNGILSVSAKDRYTGKDLKITIKSASLPLLSKDEVIRAKDEAFRYRSQDEANVKSIKSRRTGSYLRLGSG